MIELHQEALACEGGAGEVSWTFHRGTQGLAELGEKWRQAGNSVSGKRFFHLYPWYRGYIECLEHDPGSVMFCVMSRGTSPVAIFPLKRVNRKVGGIPMRVMEIPTHDHIDLGDFIIAGDQDTARLLETMVRNLRRITGHSWDAIHVPQALDDSAVAGALRRSALRLWHVNPPGKSNYVNCNASYDEMSASFDGHFRRNIRRLGRRAREMGAVEYHSYRSVEDINRYLPDFIRVEAAGWKGQQGTSSAIACDKEAECFYRNLVEGFGPAGQCMLNLMTLDGKYIAGQLCLVVDGTVYILKIGFDEAYASIAPGNLIMEELFRQCAADKQINTISFVTGKDWNYLWGAKSLAVHDYRIFNRATLRGWFGYLFFRAKDLARRMAVPRRLKRSTPATA